MAKNTPPRAELVESPRGATWMHADLAGFIKDETGYDADETTIRLAFALRNEYRKTERYQNAKQAYKEEREAERQRAKEERAKAREEAKAKREAEKAEKAAKNEKDAA